MSALAFDTQAYVKKPFCKRCCALDNRCPRYRSTLQTRAGSPVNQARRGVAACSGG